MQNRALSTPPPSPMAIDHTSFQQVFSKIFPFQTLQKLIRKNSLPFIFNLFQQKICIVLREESGWGGSNRERCSRQFVRCPISAETMTINNGCELAWTNLYRQSQERAPIGQCYVRNSQITLSLAVTGLWNKSLLRLLNKYHVLGIFSTHLL